MEEYESFGEVIQSKEAIAPSDLIDKLNDADSVQVTLKAQVDEVCQMKGCWMQVSDDQHSLFVKFKDYGFFVPKDIAGKEVIMEGIAFQQITSVEDLRHYAKDAGQTQAEIDKIVDPKEEISFVANGVLVKK
ncbi:MAG: DUF4920 domain-containing protein [Saprospiraceae bacterium]|nr:DUF4920 domain-containing protein [Saprospiraceae bacterium]